MIELIAERRHPDLEAVADLEALDEILAQVEAQPDIAEVDQREQRHAGRHILAELGADLVDLRRERRLDRQLGDLGLERRDRGVGLGDVGLGDAALLGGVAGDRLLVGELGLLAGCAARRRARRSPRRASGPKRSPRSVSCLVRS